MARRTVTLKEFDALPTLGWLHEGSPITELNTLSRELGFASLSVKRDDQIRALSGGSKVRKLDVLLASEPYRSAPAWHSVGALGSGHLVALAAASERLGKALQAHLFRTELSPHALDNLAYTATHAARLYDERSRLSLLVTPALWLSDTLGGLPVIAPGASTPLGVLGMVRAGVELGEDVRAGRLEPPEHLYVALGTGGAAVGLSIGCALAGIECAVHGVAVVERPLATRRRLETLTANTVAELSRHGVPLPAAFSPRPLRVVRNQLGRGYSRATTRGAEAAKRFEQHGIGTEPAYTQKALAALLAEADDKRGAHVLFWNTLRGPLPPPDPNWRERLPPGILAYMHAPSKSRRRLLVGGVGVAAALLTLSRIDLRPLSGWNGICLSAGEASVLRAVAEVVLPTGADLARTLEGADRYLASLPAGLRDELGLLFLALEQAPVLLGVGFRRFSEAPVAERDRVLTLLSSFGGSFVAAYRGVRDLCFIGYYQQPAAWAALGYEGPLVGPREASPSALVAPLGMLPRHAERSTTE